MKNKKILALTTIGLGLLLLLGNGCAPTSAPASNNQPDSSSTSTSGPIKEFTVQGGNYYFNPGQITVNKGDRVKITFQNNDGFHNLTVDGFNVATPAIGAGQNASVEFTADKAGSFQYYCNIDGHRDKGMNGTLTVK